MDHRRRTIHLFFGLLLWLTCAVAAFATWRTVQLRTGRQTSSAVVSLAPGDRCAPGDLVFVETDHGLDRVGVVASRGSQPDSILLAIETDAFAKLNTSTQAVCRQTPLSVEQAVGTLLPPGVQRRAAEYLASDWRGLEDGLATIWEPIIKELAGTYLKSVGVELEASIKKREHLFWDIALRHGQALATEWPAVQDRLSPILQRHLTPVLSRLVENALADAPKVSIAWEVAKGNSADAFRLMIDWLVEYLSNMSDEDLAEMGEAVQKTWSVARQDAILVRKFERLGHGILEDRQLRDLFIEIYREAIANNPRTTDFVRTQILESPQLRSRMFDFFDAFAPTARKVAAICLFDENGATRPEVVHLVRSVGFRRRVSWVVLRTTDMNALALEGGATLGTPPPVDPG